jgi:hypothetical protein
VCRVQILVAVTMNSAALRDVTPCALVEIYRRFGKLACLDHQSKGVSVGGAEIPNAQHCDIHIMIINLSKKYCCQNLLTASFERFVFHFVCYFVACYLYNRGQIVSA